MLASTESAEEKVQKMNQTLEMMGGQPEIVCQIFGALTGGGVMPNMRTYELVIRASVQQGLYECAEMLLTAAETQGLPFHGLVWQCLEGSPGNAFVLKWAPKVLEAGWQVPARCFIILFRDRAAVGGMKLAVALYKLLLRVKSDEDKAAQALVQAIAEIQQLGKLSDVMQQMQCASQRVNELVRKLPQKMATPAGPAAVPAHPAVAMLPAVVPAPLPAVVPAIPGGPPAPPAIYVEQSAASDSEPGSPISPLPPVAVSPPSPVKEEEAGMFLEALQKSHDKQDAAAALKTLHDMKAAGMTIAYSLYHGVFKVCIATGSVAEAEGVLDEMREHYNVDATCYAWLVRAYGVAGRLDKAERVLERMKAHDVPEDEGTWNALLECAARSGRHGKCWGVLEQMTKQNIAVGTHSLCLLLKNITEKTDKVKVRRCIELVEQHIATNGADADVTVFNGFIDMCCRVKDASRVEGLFRRMRELKLQPSPATVGTLLKFHAERNDGSAVVRLWDEMKEADVTMNTVTYGCMLDACVKSGNFEKAEKVFWEIKNMGMHRNTILYSTMIKSYSKQKKLRKAMGIVEEMKAEGVPLNSVTFNSLVDAAVRCRDMPAATTVLEQMKANGVEPDLITYSTLIKGFCDQGDLRVACSLLNRLRSLNMKCDEILYNSLLEGSVKANDIQRGVELFQEMVADHIPMSNITFSIMVKLYAQAGRLDQAMSLVQRMEPEFGVRPTIAVFSCIVKCCIAAQRNVQAAKLLLGLPQATKVQPDQQLYASVLPGLISQKQLDVALDVFESLCHVPAADRNFDASQLAQQLYHMIGQGSSALKEKARKVLESVRPTLAANQDQILSGELGWGKWGGQEFVPGKPYYLQAAVAYASGWKADWEAYQDPAENQAWQGYGWGHGSKATPPRLRKEGDENSSPNVMEILLQTDDDRLACENSYRPKQSPVDSPQKTLSDGPVELPVHPLAGTNVLMEQNANK